MSFSTKLLPVLALVVSMAPLAAQVRNDGPHLMNQHDATQSAPKFWATSFGFQLVNCKHSACTKVQTGFWPRPLDCAR
jgi:hypothetical protein